ncbi:MAG: hypothetical protein DCF20_00805 [Pseudanabaena sp.]|nr:MAG: hypothetical protein DCF20_00805 [Pseudanabaena sp.]
MKIEIGHWESDTVIGCNHKGIVVTHIDKASKYLLAGLAKNKTMAEINRVTIKLFEPREFYPKRTNFKIVKEDFQKAVNFINHRPRKSLD